MARPPKPTEKLRLHGTYRKERHAHRVDDSGLPADIVRPDGMASTAQAFWDEHVPRLFAAGFAKSCDLPALRGMAEWWGKYREAMVTLETEDLGLHATNTIQNLAGSAWKHFSNLAGRFGMTPADRARLSADPQRPADEFEAEIA